MPQVSSNEIPYNRSAQAKVDRILTAGGQEGIIAEAERILFNPCEVHTSPGTQNLFKSLSSIFLSIFLILLTVVTAVAFFILPDYLKQGKGLTTTPKTSSQGWKGQMVEKRSIAIHEQHMVNAQRSGNHALAAISIAPGLTKEEAFKKANSFAVGDTKLSRLSPMNSPIQDSNTNTQGKQSFQENRPHPQKGHGEAGSFRDISLYMGKDKISRDFSHPEPLKQRKVRDFIARQSRGIESELATGGVHFLAIAHQIGSNFWFNLQD